MFFGVHFLRGTLELFRQLCLILRDDPLVSLIFPFRSTLKLLMAVLLNVNLR